MFKVDWHRSYMCLLGWFTAKLALSMCKTNLTNSCTGTASHGQSHQNIWSTFPFTWSCLFQKGLLAVRKFSDLGILIHVGEEWDYGRTSCPRSVPCPKGFTAFLSQRVWSSACYGAVLVPKAPAALGSAREMRHWNLCSRAVTYS